jgi:uncharacterized protein
MFPLGSVLFPGVVLPLHVFEARYRVLVRDCLDGDREFGVVLIERGSEVGGGDVRTMVGTVARMVEVAELGGGRYALVTLGTRRIAVRAWLPDDPYPLADVDDWPEQIDGLDEARLAADLVPVVAKLRRVLAMTAEVGDSAAPLDSELSDDPLIATYHVAALAPFGPADQFQLLAAPGPSERLALLADMLDDRQRLLELRLGAGDERSD